jgi:hypothetical protein
LAGHPGPSFRSTALPPRPTPQYRRDSERRLAPSAAERAVDAGGLPAVCLRSVSPVGGDLLVLRSRPVVLRQILLAGDSSGAVASSGTALSSHPAGSPDTRGPAGTIAPKAAARTKPTRRSDASGYPRDGEGDHTASRGRRAIVYGQLAGVAGGERGAALGPVPLLRQPLSSLRPT